MKKTTTTTTTNETTTKHTPGPWFTLDTGLDVFSELTNGDPDYLPRRRHISAAITTCQFDQEARANAALIAAAPELLAALRDILGDRDGNGEGCCRYCGRDLSEADQQMFCTSDDCAATIARATISKATGQN